jgi:pantoate--beta-alanine ligase
LTMPARQSFRWARIEAEAPGADTAKQIFVARNFYIFEEIMNIETTISGLRKQLRGHHPPCTALVPTMGNLHAGHIHLVEEANDRADRVVVSIFVNPLQFGPSEDFHSYPRTFKRDCAMLEQAGVDLLFAPTVEAIYPHGEAASTRVCPPDSLGGILCGAARPGHFTGVATVVAMLLNAAQPDMALFGEKDYQQLLVIKKMAEDLLLPVEIVGIPTVREADGLAMSSRNGYLSAEQRAIAPCLYQTLQWTSGQLQGGRQDFAALEQEAAAMLQATGFRPDYAAIRRADDLAAPQPGERLVVLAAAWLGKARLIDNSRV